MCVGLRPRARRIGYYGRFPGRSRLGPRKDRGGSRLVVDIAKLTAVEALAQYRAGTLSPVEVTRAALDRIAALNPRYNAFCLVDEERALADAHASEERWQRGAPIGLIDGVPATIQRSDAVDRLADDAWLGGRRIATSPG